MKIKDLDSIDSQKMYKVYDNWPEIARESFEIKFDRFNMKGINQVIFAGMGGSGSIGDALSSILSKKGIHLKSVKGYSLPRTSDANSLIITTSVSGETQETLEILKKAAKTNSKVIAFSSGGSIKKFCQDNKIFFQEIPMMHSPRASFTKFLFSILNVLKDVLSIEEKDVEEAILDLKKTREMISSNNLGEDNVALKLAEWIKGIPLVYYPNGLQSAAIRFKNSLQENSKKHVIAEEILESCHNGIVAWEKDSNVQPIFIKGTDDHVKTIERWNILEQFFKQEKIEFFEIRSINGNIISKIVNLIYLLDYSSIYHSVLKKIDPSPVRSIDFVKAKL
jgi:glucose/mannose-6-phosphate isomerase